MSCLISIYNQIQSILKARARHAQNKYPLETLTMGAVLRGPVLSDYVGMGGVSILYTTVSEYTGFDCGGGGNKHDLTQTLIIAKGLRYIEANQTVS